MTTTLNLKSRLSLSERAEAERQAKRMGITLDQWLERAAKAAIYAGVEFVSPPVQSSTRP